MTWNELLFALVITSSNARTASVGLATFLEAEGSVQWQLVAALGVMTILPVFVFMGAMHRFMVRGLRWEPSRGDAASGRGLLESFWLTANAVKVGLGQTQIDAKAWRVPQEPLLGGHEWFWREKHLLGYTLGPGGAETDSRRAPKAIGRTR